MAREANVHAKLLILFINEIRYFQCITKNIKLTNYCRISA